MKRLLYLPAVLTCMALLLAACGKSSSFQLKGELSDGGSDPILVVYDDPVSKTDTIFPQKGKFTYSFTPDTLHLFRLLSDSGYTIPVFANASWKVRIKGSFSQPEIKGDGPNGEYGSFLETVRNLSAEESVQQAEAFIRSHPQSYLSAYLIDRYFAQTAHPDLDKIRQLIHPLEGSIKDTRILVDLLQDLPGEQEKPQTHLGFYSVKTRKGTYVSWNTSAPYSLTLVNFWASWDNRSRTIHDELYGLTKEFKPDEFRVVNISLDYSRKDWEKACHKDSTQWIESCDQKGWESSLVRQQAIKRLPATLLVDKNRKILATNLYGETLKEEALRLIQEARQRAASTQKKK